MRYLLPLIFLFTLPAKAAVYKCVVNGETTFSDRPCAADAARVEVKVYRPTADESAQAEARVVGLRESIRAKEDYRRRRQLVRDIRDVEGEIASLQRAMDTEHRALQKKKRQANNNLAGATWEESISTEMRAVTSRYVAKIDFAKEKLARYRAELDRLKD